MDPHNPPLLESTNILKYIVYMALVWCYALFISNHFGSFKASWVLSFTGVFEAKWKFHMWWLYLMAYLFMKPINFFLTFNIHCNLSTVVYNSINYLLCDGKQTKLWRWKLLNVFGVTLFVAVTIFLSCHFSNIYQFTIFRNFNGNIQMKTSTITLKFFCILTIGYFILMEGNWSIQRDSGIRSDIKTGRDML